jgi:hypothetical protein
MTETPAVEPHPAATFNVEDWLQDARMPEESADVYKRADVIGELQALQRKIVVQREAAAGAEASAAEASEVYTLEARYQELLDTFADSQLTVFVRALSPDEKKDMRAAHDERVKDLDALTQNNEFGYDLLAASIAAVQPFGGERVDVAWSHAQVRALENKLGATQMSLILQAHQNAQNRLPAVDADFLLKPSGSETGQG